MVDLAAVAIHCLCFIHYFKVLSFVASCHLQILGLEILSLMRGVGWKSLPLLPRLWWTKNDKIYYGERVNKALSRVQFSDDIN